MKKDDKKSDRPRVNAKPIKTGPHKGFCYFEQDKVKYVFEAVSKLVKGTMNDKDELEELTDDQIKIIEDMPPFQLEKKSSPTKEKVEEKKVESKSSSKKVEKKDEVVEDDDIEEEEIEEEDESSEKEESEEESD